MFLLPTASDEILNTWPGQRLQGWGALSGYTIVWCGEPDDNINRTTLEPKHVFILRHGDNFKYAYHDKDGFKELPDKWYGKCFGGVSEVPETNLVTVLVRGVYVELPFLPQRMYDRKISTKRRKKTHTILFDRVYPMWRHVKGDSVHFKIAREFKDIFDRADANEVSLADPFQGYSSLDDVLQSKTGKLAFLTVAGFVYYHCRDHLGYPATQSY